MSGEVWVLIFMLLILKIPVIYVGMVIWYAIKAEPRTDASDEREYSLWRPWVNRHGPRPRNGRPHGSRDAVRAARAARRGRVAS